MSFNPPAGTYCRRHTANRIWAASLQVPRDGRGSGSVRNRVGRPALWGVPARPVPGTTAVADPGEDTAWQWTPHHAREGGGLPGAVRNVGWRTPAWHHQDGVIITETDGISVDCAGRVVATAADATTAAAYAASGTPAITATAVAAIPAACTR